VPNLLVTGFHQTRGALSSIPFSDFGVFEANVKNFRFKGKFQLNAIPGNFLNVQSLQSTLEMDSVSVDFESFGPQYEVVKEILNSNLLSHIYQPSTQAKINQRISRILLPVLNGAFNRMTLSDFYA
jgi:hypothetical protein